MPKKKTSEETPVIPLPNDPTGPEPIDNEDGFVKLLSRIIKREILKDAGLNQNKPVE